MATRNNRQAVRNRGSVLPWWALILIGIVIGAGFMGYVAYHGLIPNLRRSDAPQANPSAAAKTADAAGIAATSAAASGSQFDFYKVLPEKEVVIPNAQLSAMAKAEQQKAAAANNASAAAAATNAGAAVAAKGGYVLQVGAFPGAADAESVKAKLALQGFAAHVQTVTLDGQTWNRVRVGPFASATQLQAVQKQLLAAGFHAVPLKEK